VTAAVLPRSLAPGRRAAPTALLAVILVVGLATIAGLARFLETHQPVFADDLGDEIVAMSPAAVPPGFKGLVADWYWIRALQYLGRKLQQGTVALDRASGVNSKILAPLLDLTTTLDPRFGAAYEFAAVILPSVDVDAAIALTRKGLSVMPEAWELHQQHAYIHWQRGDFRAAAEAFRDGARLSSAKWMAQMAARMEAEGGDREVARDMYRRMYQQSNDAQVKQWATTRLMQVQSFEERERIRAVLLDAWRRRGTCVDRWSDVTPELRRAGLRANGEGAPLDPSGTPYALALGGCLVAVDPRSPVPAH
jgi:tetratricopeptide (TPR) repeat protein